MTCVICGAELNESTTYIGEDDGNRYCNDCYYDQYCECQYCGDWHLRDNMHYSTNHDCFYCDDCYGEESDNMTIREYHDRDIPITFKSLENEDTKLYYGFELEVEGTYDAKLSCDDMATYIRENYSQLDLCFEYDSSLTRGFEIISQPMTINYINEHKEDFKNMLNDLQENDYTSHNSGHCGLHIHVSRNAFGENDKEQEKNINKLLLFTETYKKELQSFSRRRDYGYCAFLSNSSSISNERYFKSTKILGEENKNKGRYQVINTQNANTIEIRVFRGTLRYETFIATLTFVDNLMNTILTKSISKISWDKVINYNAIPELVEYVENKNLFNSTPMVDETKNVEKEYKKKVIILQEIEDKFVCALKDIFTKVQDYCDNLKFDVVSFEDGEDFNKISIRMGLYAKLINKLNSNMYLLNIVTSNDKTNYIKVLCKNMNEYNNTLTSFINDLTYCFEYTDNKNDKIIEELNEYRGYCAYTEATITEI